MRVSLLFVCHTSLLEARARKHFCEAAMEDSPPPTKRFSSLLDDSPADATLHLFDSPTNKANRQMAFAMELLQISHAQDLPQLWDEHCLVLLGPFPGTERVICDTPAGTPAEIKTFDHPLVKAIGGAWELRTQTALHRAFPRYCNFGYSVSEMALMEVIQFCYAKTHYPEKMFMMIEAMSGMRNLSHSFDRHGMVALSLDKKYSANCNFFDDKGFENTITAYRLLDLHGLGWMALECSNWVFISKSSTGRTREYPDGNESLPKVAEANSVRDRAVFLLLTLFISQRKWIVEQEKKAGKKSRFC